MVEEVQITKPIAFFKTNDPRLVRLWNWHCAPSPGTGRELLSWKPFDAVDIRLRSDIDRVRIPGDRGRPRTKGTGVYRQSARPPAMPTAEKRRHRPPRNKERCGAEALPSKGRSTGPRACWTGLDSRRDSRGGDATATRTRNGTTGHRPAATCVHCAQARTRPAGSSGPSRARRAACRA